jgi:hypothetical protein
MVRRVFVALLLSLALVAAGQPVYGIVIDDFSTGEIVVNGPAIEDQTGLDPSHVIGGTRRIDVGKFGDGSRFEVADDQLQFNSTGRGYLTLTYGAVESLDGVDLTQNGDDRIRIKFGDVTSNYTPMGFYVNLSPGSSGNGVSWQATQAWSGATIEIPFAGFPTLFTSVQKIAFDALRNPAGTGFVVESIATAGPSLAADFNRDGLVDGDDINQWKQNVGVVTSVYMPKVFAASDANLDGRVDGADFLAWQRTWGGQPTSAIAIPEPASSLAAVLLVLAMTPAILRRRRGA